ncbi:sensor histidine kinase NtrY-like [Govanella unica]|uniref:histidine kinase n=1 Tax=Govanella unica TaxID=2975056 RepID=A0A9X3Z757_9PROT|nr:PAS domain-containing sensor histidine kinase [Govania unica]MDA5193816.1 PAS domain-containing sensor histidine kinase [Govania unica]
MDQLSVFSLSRPWHRFVLWARRVGLVSKLAIALVFAVTVAALATYTLLTQSDPANPRPKTLYILLLVNLVLALPLGALIARLLVQLFSARRSGLAGARLHGRMVALFSLIAITPTIIMAAFTLFFFEEGLQSWFSDKVKTVVGNATSVAEAYIEEHQKVIKADILGMANDLNSDALILNENRALLEQSLNLHARLLSLSEAIIFDGSGHPIVRANADFSLTGGDPFPRDALQRAADGRALVLASQNDDRVRALVKLNRFFDAYLYVSRYVDPRALALVYQTRTATTEYELLNANLSNYRLLFNLTYIGVSFIILLAAILAGLWFANKLATPISNLVQASERVRQGDFSTRVPVQNAYDELGILSRSFNRMTGQLKAQRDALVQTNYQLEDRRRFTEAVLSGVSSGVLGLSPSGEITLPNRSASMLLEVPEEDLVGHHLLEILPEVDDLFEEARGNPEGLVRNHLTVKRGDKVRNFHVRVAAEMEDGKIEGYVVTFDDITEQVSAQRNAAWSDVARRIAHEIKNPLTPIQLSAERLQRKYGREITTEPQVFQQCTDTIIRQVGDLRTIVDEFSAFARMPAAIFQPANLLEILQHAVFLQEVAHPGVSFNLHKPDGPLMLVCDNRLLTQAFTNLLKNAVEAIEGKGISDAEGGPKGAIEIFISVNEEGTSVTIRDDGPGFPENLRDRLTEPYVTTRAKGTGLGLAIVKKIMEEHGAVLELSNWSGGAEVTVAFNHAQLAKRIPENSPSDRLAGPAVTNL